MTSQGRYAEAHSNRTGPGDARPKASQIVDDEGMLNALSGKSIFITGASSGIGIETAKALYQTGATLYFGVRNTAKGEKVATDIAGNAKPNRIEIIQLNLGSLASVRAAAKEFYKKTNNLNILINNAGEMATPEGTKTEDGFDAQFGTNHLGHFLLFQLLKPALLAASTPEFQSRVVSVASSGHRFSPVCFDDINQEKNYDKWVAYGASKTANIYLANEIDRRFGAEGLHATSVHPGGILTDLARHILSDPGTPAFIESLQNVLKSPEQGAATTVWAAIGKDGEGKGGQYLEDCSVSQPVDPNRTDLAPADPGYKDYIYDEEAAKKLWDVSEQLIGDKR